MTNRSNWGTELQPGGSVKVPPGFHAGTGNVTAATLSSVTQATAIAGDIRSKKTAWVNGSKLTGTMQVYGEPFATSIMVNTNSFPSATIGVSFDGTKLTVTIDLATAISKLSNLVTNVMLGAPMLMFDNCGVYGLTSRSGGPNGHGHSHATLVIWDRQVQNNWRCCDLADTESLSGSKYTYTWNDAGGYMGISTTPVIMDTDSKVIIFGSRVI